jgi:hypothetical protein
MGRKLRVVVAGAGAARKNTRIVCGMVAITSSVHSDSIDQGEEAMSVGSKQGFEDKDLSIQQAI